MDTEKLSKTKIGNIFIHFIASIMESRLRYKFFGPNKILEGSGILPSMKVLEIGCGTGFYTIPASRILGDQGYLIAMDTLPESVEEVTKKVQKENLKNVKVIKGNALDTKLDNKFFDQIIIFGVIPAPMLPMEKLLLEMHRILKQGGVMSVWPPSWVKRSILKSELFTYLNSKYNVINYKKVDK
jgi:ubiquinone/menaquinone biosynthesis C-methylase UbiE